MRKQYPTKLYEWKMLVLKMLFHLFPFFNFKTTTVDLSKTVTVARSLSNATVSPLQSKQSLNLQRPGKDPALQESLDFVRQSQSKLAQEYLSHIMRKQNFCPCKNKGAEQLCSNCTAYQRLCFRYMDSAMHHLLTSKISSF